MLWLYSDCVSAVKSSPHTGHSLVPSPDVYRSSFQSHCHRGFLQGPSPQGCRYTLNTVLIHTISTTILSCKSTVLTGLQVHAEHNINTHNKYAKVCVKGVSCTVCYPCSLQGRHSGRSTPVCSARSVLPPRWLYSDTDRRSDRLERPSSRHIFLRSESQ